MKKLPALKKVKRKCPVCGGNVLKYSPIGNFKKGFWYECEGCGLPLKECVCRRTESRQEIPDCFGTYTDSWRGIECETCKYLEECRIFAEAKEEAMVIK